MSFNLRSEDSQLFLIRRLAPYKLVVDEGKIYYFSPRDTYRGFEDPTENLFNESDSGVIKSVSVPQKEIDGIFDSGRIYLQINTGGAHSTYAFLVDICDESGVPVPEYHGGFEDGPPTYMGTVSKKDYGVYSAQILFQAGDPESLAGVGEKNQDKSISVPESPTSWLAQTHILIGEVFYDSQAGKMSFKQYHQGPLFFEIPEVYYGDQDFRPT